MKGFIVLIGRTDARVLTNYPDWPEKIGMALNTGALAEYHRVAARHPEGEDVWLYIHSSRIGQVDAVLKDLGWERAPNLAP